jgi:hypothetical protein
LIKVDGLPDVSFQPPGTFVLLERADPRATLAGMKSEASLSAAVPRLQETRSQRFFYSVFLPLGAVANLVLGLGVLVQMKLDGEFGWLELGTGALCCMIAGWLAASAWSKSYWNRSMARQIALWGRIADAFFAWLEDVPLPAESLHRLKSSLDEVVPAAKQG